MGVTFRNKNGAPLTNNIPHPDPHYPPGGHHQRKRFEENPNPVAKHPVRPNNNSSYEPPVHWRAKKPGQGSLPSPESAQRVAENLAYFPEETGYYNAQSYGNISSAQHLARPWTTGKAYRNPVIAGMAAAAVDWANPPKEGSVQETPGCLGGSCLPGRGGRKSRRRISKRKANRRTSKK